MQEEMQRPIEKGDLFNLRFIQSAALSPDGGQVVYVVSAYDEADDADYSHIWLYSTATGTSRQLTFGKQNNSGPKWSPDGKSLAFISTRAEKAQLYLLPLDGDEASALTDLEQGVAGEIAWSPDGCRIAFSAGPAPEDAPDLSKPYRVTRHVYRFDAIGYLDAAIQDLYLVTVEGGDVQRLIQDDTMKSVLGWSADGSRLLYAANMLPKSHNAYFLKLRVLDLASGAVTNLLDEWGDITSARWHPNDRQILFVGIPRGKPIGTKADLYLVDAMSENVPENRSSTLAWGIGGGLQADMPTALSRGSGSIFVKADGASAYVRVQVGGTIQIHRISLIGAEEHRPVVVGDRTAFLLDMDANTGTLLFAVSDFNRPFELCMADGDGGHERQITQINDDFLKGIAKAQIEHFRCPSKDGVEVEGWMIMPAGTDGSTSARPFPTVLCIHGGPHSAFGQIYHFDTQMLVGAGFAVLMVNHRASTGYGDAFATAIKGDWGNLDYADLMAGVDFAIDLGFADADRLGVCGLSGGGNLSCWIVGQTGRFKAAVPENPVTNWQSFYGVSDLGVWFSVEELGGHPHEIPDLYARCSPITYAHNCTTPTLLIQGEADWRCPAEQSEQFYNTLKANGCTVEMVRLPGSPHGGSIRGEPVIRRAQNEALLAWMERFVKG